MTASTLPPPARVTRPLLDKAATGEMARIVGATTVRLAIGAAAGTLLGTLRGASRSGRSVLDPLIHALRNVPSPAWIPLFILWLGIFDRSKITLIVVGVFFRSTST